MIKKLDFLRDTAGVLNFGRVVPFSLFILNIVALVITALFTDVLQHAIGLWQCVIHCAGFLTGCAVYFIEIVFRERVKLKVKVGDKEYGLDNTGATNA